MKEWVKMPSYWLRDEKSLPLCKMKWSGSNKSDQIAALMLYIVLVHYATEEPSTRWAEPGISELTYTQLAMITGLSRAKIAGGLKILIDLNVIRKVNEGRNNAFKISNIENKGGWAKLPAKGLYADNLTKIPAFHACHLRHKNELNAMKLYLIILALRSNEKNFAIASYDKLSEYTGIPRNQIKPAISLLINLDLVHVESGKTDLNMFATVNMYRPCHLDVRRHRGTTGRMLGPIVDL